MYQSAVSRLAAGICLMFFGALLIAVDGAMARAGAAAGPSTLSMVAVAPIPTAAPAAADDDEQDEGEAEEQRQDQNQEEDAEEAETQDDKEQTADDKKQAETEQTKNEPEAAKTDAATAQPDAKADAKEAAQPAAKADAKPEEKPAAKPPAKKRKMATAETKRLKVEVPLDGTFVARTMNEVVLRPETWSGYEIVEVAEHGSRVRRGQVVARFDDKRINEAIADLELEQRLNELAILRAEEEMPRQERLLALNLENAERRNRETREDYQRYNDIDRPLIVKSYEYSVKRSQFNLDYEKEELEQLEKMYAADDLTEDTEEIILKRQRNLVDFAEFSLSSAKTNRAEVMDILLPRMDIEVKQSLEAAELALARARMASALDLSRTRYELEQRKQSRARSLERHAKLISDRGLMELKAPADGIVYYGQCVDGRWTDMTAMLNRLKPHGSVSSGTVLMTILEPRPLYVQANVDEAKRPEISAGQKIKVAPPAEGSPRVDGRVAKVADVPTGAGRFAVELELEQEAVPDWVVPGMTGKVRVVSYDKADALVVPKAAVHTDEDDEDVKYVWVVESDDPANKAERRDVTVGKTSGNDVEIIKGLAKGDKVSLDDESAKPAEAKPAE
jgi:multidrug resistance efflux pump